METHAATSIPELLSYLRHELRTPLTSILGFSELLELGVLDSEQQAEAIAQIRKAGKQLQEMIDGALDSDNLGHNVLEHLKKHGETADIRDVVGEFAGTLDDTLEGGR